MHVAPPEDRLDPVQQRQAPVVAEHVAQPRVDALDGVVGGRPLAAALLLHLDEGEQRPVLDELAQPAPGLSQPLVRVDALAVLHRVLPQERRPPRAPLAVLHEPRRSALGVLGVLEPVGDAQQLDPRLQLGLQRRAALHLVRGVERAALDPGAGPDERGRFGEPGGAVRDEHLGGGDAQHQRRPRGSALGLRQVPADDVAARDGDQHDGLPAQPYAVEEDDAVDLAGGGRDGPDPPRPRRLAPEGRPARLQVGGHRVFGEQPPQERRELLRSFVVLAHARRAALGASPPLRPCLRRPVPLHLRAACGAFGLFTPSSRLPAISLPENNA